MYIYFQLFELIFVIFQDPRVLDAMIPYFVSYYGNPHSRTHAYGWESEAAVEKARKVSTYIENSVIQQKKKNTARND